jgi:hypothetical protein
MAPSTFGLMLLVQDSCVFTTKTTKHEFQCLALICESITFIYESTYFKHSAGLAPPELLVLVEASLNILIKQISGFWFFCHCSSGQSFSFLQVGCS